MAAATAAASSATRAGKPGTTTRARAVSWMRERGYESIVLLGLRLGGLLALDAARDPAANISRVVLWQPVLRGEQMMTQFLRLRLAADLSSGKAGERRHRRDQEVAGGRRVRRDRRLPAPPRSGGVDRQAQAGRSRPLLPRRDRLDRGRRAAGPGALARARTDRRPLARGRARIHSSTRSSASRSGRCRKPRSRRPCCR